MTFRDMSGYLNQLLAGALAMVITVVGATWFLNDRISEVRQDVEIVKTRLSILHPGASTDEDPDELRIVSARKRAE